MTSKWEIKPIVPDDFIKKNPEYNKIILQLLFNRHLIEKPEIELFFKPDKMSLSDPFLLKDMKAAAALAIKHIKEQNLIVVYGDFDADGVTATATLVEILNIFKAKTGVYIPGRTSEGYGLNKKAIAELIKIGAKLIITVDNGIRNKEEAAYAKSLGLDVIITDHHEPPPDKNDWPDCLIINPKAEDYAYKSLAGVGVAFKFVQGLIKLSKLDEQLKNKLAEKVLDLVAIGTVADMVSLLGENRTLVSQGLKIINQGKRLGVAELIKIAQANGNAKKINSFTIGWQISPRLNAAGRLDHANTAYELLVTKDKNEAQAIAKKLNIKNSERQKITEDITAYCRKVVEEKMLGDKILIVCSPNIESASGEAWPEGVVGLVAGRLCEAYARPVLAITKIKNEIKGSGRSIDEFNIMEAIESSGKYLEKFGGHAAACGFTLKSREDLKGFMREMKKIVNKALAKVELAPKILIEAEIDLPDINDELLEALEKFEPYGEDNDKPKFLSRGMQIMDKMNMGANAQHIKFRFGSIWAVAFSQAENLKEFKIGDKVDAVYYLEFNEFNGRRAAQMKIVDIKNSSS
ncbi:MAG: single-stranded-DNA-specific exonuclease RecJ [Patescibacteria group bacterium]|nr:single-stranded-DNA-specific exonuclease RecJ [Patescibacteria group bacterium]